MIKHCYIHIPFCNKICSYCDFCKLLIKDSWIDKYLESLQQEIEEIYQQDELETIYIGGGTPSCLSLSQLEKLLKMINNFKKKKNVEYTIEGNFESTSPEKLELYKKYGVNRLSFGLETTNSKLLKILNREFSNTQVLSVIKKARQLGFQNINVDLMYALPGETKEDLKKDIEYILSLGIEHISTYSLIIEENTVLKINQFQNLDSDTDFEMYQIICKELPKQDYLHYEISNFAKAGYESLHNQAYWDNEEYYGFGLGASSYIDNKRIENTRSWNQYIVGNRIKSVESLTEEDKIEYEVILNLRKREGISCPSFQKKYHKELKDCYDYFPLLQQNLLVKEANRLFIPEDKWYISNEIIVRLLEKKI